VGVSLFFDYTWYGRDLDLQPLASFRQNLQNCQ